MKDITLCEFFSAFTGHWAVNCGNLWFFSSSWWHF